MPEYLKSHPVLSCDSNPEFVDFYYNGNKYQAKEGTMITSALAAYGIYNTGKNLSDHSDQGLFCANGMCSQCRIIADGEIVKGCMAPIKKGISLYSIDSLPKLKQSKPENFPDILEISCDVLVIGGGPAGLAACRELKNKKDLNILLIDDKETLGGKLLLQTHKFFGSKADCYAGTRGIEIAEILEDEIKNVPNITVLTGTYFAGVYEDKKIGLYTGTHYILVTTESVILASGAREKFLSFDGNHLPGIFGAGAFQTLLNRDKIKGSENIFIVGSGNVGLIAAYHAMQAGIKVAGICDAASKASGYKVHLDKILRYGVPVYLNHIVIKAEGEHRVNNITISECDSHFKPLYKNMKKFDIDTVLIAVGLKENNEFEPIFKDSGINLYKAGDANEIAEASSAMFSGKLAAAKLLKDLNYDISIDESIYKKEKILKSPGGKISPPVYYEGKNEVFPNIFCYQQIPCNPCVTSCPVQAIQIKGDPIFDLPYYVDKCIGCGKCVTVCPGLAITLVNKKRKKNTKVLVTFPFEFEEIFLNKEQIDIVDYEGNFLCHGEFESIRLMKKDRRSLVDIWIEEAYAKKAASFKMSIQGKITKPVQIIPESSADNHQKSKGQFICICERVKESDVRELVESGIYDINFIKAATRLSMGACGGKSCSTTIISIFREFSVNASDVIHNTPRPFVVEIPLKAFSGNRIPVKFQELKKHLLG